MQRCRGRSQIASQIMSQMRSQSASQTQSQMYSQELSLSAALEELRIRARRRYELPAATPERSVDQLTLDDWRTIHSYRDARALARCEGLTVKMIGHLVNQLLELELLAEQRGIPAALMNQWREYPRSLIFGTDTQPLTGEIDHEAPPVKPRRKKPLPPPATTPPAEALDKLQQLLAASIAQATADS